jgi:broad specificity phosphatase PhoE
MIHHLYLVRHGETDWNRENRAQGQHDVPLNEKGREQARHIGVFLRRVQPSTLICSDLSRARETAAIIGSFLDIQPVVYPELRERDMGAFSGLTRQEMRTHGVTDQTRWDDLPGVETDAAVLKRTKTCLEQFINTEDGVGVVVTHGGVIRVLIDHIMGTRHHQPKGFILHNGLVVILQQHQGHLLLDGLLNPDLIRLLSDNE